jgi:hypothetical protein
MTHTTYRNKSRPYTTMQKLLELEREIAERERVYDKWLKADPPKIKLEVAARQMGIIKAIAQDYREKLTTREDEDEKVD